MQLEAINSKSIIQSKNHQTSQCIQLLNHLCVEKSFLVKGLPTIPYGFNHPSGSKDSLLAL